MVFFSSSFVYTYYTYTVVLRISFENSFWHCFATFKANFLCPKLHLPWQDYTSLQVGKHQHNDLRKISQEKKVMVDSLQYYTLIWKRSFCPHIPFRALNINGCEDKSHLVISMALRKHATITKSRFQRIGPVVSSASFRLFFNPYDLLEVPIILASFAGVSRARDSISRIAKSRRQG